MSALSPDLAVEFETVILQASGLPCESRVSEELIGPSYFLHSVLILCLYLVLFTTLLLFLEEHSLFSTFFNLADYFSNAFASLLF